MDTIFDDPETRESLAKIEQALLQIASDQDVLSEFPSLQSAAGQFLKDRQHGYDEATETSFLTLYCEIHRSGSTYTASERQQLDQKQGYFNHPGGISPLLKAKPHIKNHHVIADLGAGNGLQGLLFQYLYPHEKTVQVELSGELIRIGKQFQQALRISENRIRWMKDDILNVELDEIDFLYLYRPSKPMKNGLELYENLRKKLNGRSHPLTIFSIADCLKNYLNSGYEEFYNDGHLTCFNLAA